MHGHVPGYVWVSAGRRIEGKIYPAKEAVPPAANRPASIADVQQLLALLESWPPVHPQSGRLLLLGWLGCAIVACALDWRPHIWITGAQGCGKTTPERLIANVLGSTAIHASALTEYGIRETLGDDARPVMIDEIDGDPEDCLSVRRLVNLAKLASSDNQSPMIKVATDDVKE